MRYRSSLNLQKIHFNLTCSGYNNNRDGWFPASTTQFEVVHCSDVIEHWGKGDKVNWKHKEGLGYEFIVIECV